MLITLSGIDCSGKSTQLDLLDRHLTERGLAPVRLWYRPGYSRSLDALRAAVRRVRGSALPRADSDEGRAARQRTFARPGVARTWSTMALLDMATQYAVKLRALDAAGRVVLCDRYVDDAMMDLTLRFPQLELEHSVLARAVLAACPRPDASFLLMLPFEEQTRRMAIKDEPYPDALEVRQARYARYEALAASGRHTVLDASRDIDTVHRDLVAALEPLLAQAQPAVAARH